MGASAKHTALEANGRKTVMISYKYPSMVVVAALLGWISYMQAKSPLCRAFNGQVDANVAKIAIFSSSERPEFVINAVNNSFYAEYYDEKVNYYRKITFNDISCTENDIKLSKNAKKIEKNDEKCQNLAEKLQNFLKNWRKNPKNLHLAAKTIFLGENDLDFVERITVLQSVLNNGIDIREYKEYLEKKAAKEKAEREKALAKEAVRESKKQVNTKKSPKKRSGKIKKAGTTKKRK